MKEIKYKKTKTNPLNEAIEARCNMDTPDEEVVTRGAVPVTYAKAINDHRERNRKLKKVFADKDKEQEDFVKENQDTESKPKGTSAMKKMKLSESLFDESVGDNSLCDQARGIADEISDFLDKTSRIDNLSDYLDEYDLEHIGKTMDALYDFCKNFNLGECIVNEDRGRKKIERNEAPGTLVYKAKREPLADIIQMELSTGEQCYKVNDQGKRSPTTAPCLGFDSYQIGVDKDENGWYVSVEAEDDSLADQVKAIADKYGKEFKMEKRTSRHHAEYPYYFKIYVDLKDFDEPYKG